VPAGTYLVSDEVTITVIPSGNQPPTATISAPTDGATFNQEVSITFTGSASEDGDVTASLQWVSDLDGLIGTGATFQRSDLSIGLHTITATATDNSVLSAFDDITITVYPTPVHAVWIPIVLKLSTVP
jgi:hypothetical protein